MTGEFNAWDGADVVDGLDWYGARLRNIGCDLGREVLELVVVVVVLLLLGSMFAVSPLAVYRGLVLESFDIIDAGLLDSGVDSIGFEPFGGLDSCGFGSANWKSSLRVW